MNPMRLQKIMRREIDTLRREGLISATKYDELQAQYPLHKWDFAALGRWFGIFGAISAAAGLFILGSKLFALTLENLAIALSLFIPLCFYLAFRFGHKGLTWTKRSLELLGSLAVIGLTFTLGLIFSSGSGNWPALLLIDLLILLPLAYFLRNVLLLILTVIVFFTWFGGVTGYMSGWGAYFFGMNYPMRFLFAGLLMIGMAVIHRQAETDRLRSYEGFFKVWLSGGVFFSEMALWLMSLFGNYGSIFSRYLESAAELILFNAIWAGFNVALLVIGARLQLRMLRGYAITFFLIQAYTLYFWKVARHLGPVFGTFVAGAATLALVVYFERRRREHKANPASA